MKVILPPVEETLRSLVNPEMPAGEASSMSVADSLRLRAIQFSELGRAAQRDRQPRQAIEFFLQSLVIEHMLGNERGIAADLGNLGSVYCQLNLLDKAEGTLKRAMEMDEIAGRRNDVAINLYWLAHVETRRRHFLEALQLANSSLSMMLKNNHPHAHSVSELIEWIRRKLT